MFTSKSNIIFCDLFRNIKIWFLLTFKTLPLGSILKIYLSFIENGAIQQLIRENISMHTQYNALKQGYICCFFLFEPYGYNSRSLWF